MIADRVGGIRGLEQTAVVLGNGPSLKSVDLTSLTDVATIGMNAAYRYWDRIHWYPTHYCCLDEELIATHHQEIRRLVTEEQVYSAFLTAGFLEHHPDLVDDPRFVFLDSFRGPWFERRGRELGIPRLHHRVFESSAPRKLTTGAYAVRYAMYLGARRIYLLGIDCDYIELIDEAKRAGDTALIIDETPAANPNYFFDDYQQRGDRYNIPNPVVHGGNLHLQSLEAVRDDIVENELGVEVFNCAPTSQLNTEGVFPYADLDLVMQESPLGAVVVPLIGAEVDQLLANLRSWNEPDKVPVIPGSGTPRVKLIVAFNGHRDAEVEDKIREEYASTSAIHHAFSEIRFEYCELENALDVYERDYSKPPGAHGYKSGPNEQFFRTMQRLDDVGRYAFLMETDCFPIRPDWLGELHRRVASNEGFWVLGSIYRGLASVDERYRLHINGNAVYAVGDESFRAFLFDTWRPALDESLGRTPTLAYDCALPLYFDRVGPAHEPARWKLLQTVAHRFKYTDYIQNISAREDQQADSVAIPELRTDNPSTYIVHGRQFAPPEIDVIA